jgi:hypothetical protein
MPNGKRNRLVHSYFDVALGKHQLFVYNKEKGLVAHLMISTSGEVQVFKGKIIEA